MSRFCFRPFFVFSKVSSCSSLCSCFPSPYRLVDAAPHHHSGHRGMLSRSWLCRQFGTKEAPSAAVTPNPESDPDPASVLQEWKTVYRFDGIVFARLIQRLKVYQTGFTCGIFLPWSLAATYFGFGSEYLANYAFGVATFACIMLYVMGTMASRMIGIIYVNKKDPTQLRISRLSYFGNRIDQTVPADMFFPLSDSLDNLNDAYWFWRR